MLKSRKTPKQVTWLVCLALYVVALLVHFGLVHIAGGVGQWSWIIGYGVLLASFHIRAL